MSAQVQRLESVATTARDDARLLDLLHHADPRTHWDPEFLQLFLRQVQQLLHPDPLFVKQADVPLVTQFLEEDAQWRGLRLREEAGG